MAGPDWSARLTALTPVRPLEYLELGEEVADAATSIDERDLARRLVGLAGALAPKELGRSAALALASLAEEDRQRRTLLALASLLDSAEAAGGVGGPPGVDAAVGGVTPATEHAVALSEAFSHLRRGQGARASSAVRTPEVQVLLDRYGGRLPGGPTRFAEDARAFRTGVRPSFGGPQLHAMLEVEEAVLSAAVPPNEARATQWSTALVETDGAPLLEVDVAKLETVLGVDPTRPYWRKGEWKSPSSAETPAAPR